MCTRTNSCLSNIDNSQDSTLAHLTLPLALRGTEFCDKCLDIGFLQLILENEIQDGLCIRPRKHSFEPAWIKSANRREVGSERGTSFEEREALAEGLSRDLGGRDEAAEDV